MARLQSPEMLERLAFVEKLLCEHLSGRQAAMKAANKYGVSLRMGQKYVEKVMVRWEEEAPRQRARVKEHQIRRLNQMAVRFGDNGAVLVRIEKLLAQIQGTLASVKVEHDFADIDFATLTDEQISRILDDGEDPREVVGREIH